MRTIILKLCLSIIVLLGSAGMSWSNEPKRGPSFDCDKASTPTEHSICSADNLSALDRLLADAYKIAKELDNSTKHQDEKRQWNKERSSRCGDRIECLSSMYHKRIIELCGGDDECLSHMNRQFIQNLKPAQKALIKSIPIRLIKDFNSSKPLHQGIFIDRVCGPIDSILSMEDGDKCFDFYGKVGAGCIVRKVYPSGRGDVLRYGPWIKFDGELEFFERGGAEDIPTSGEQKFVFFFCSEDNEITAKAYKLAIREFNTLAKQGDANAQYKLGFMYQRGLGVDRNYEIAAEWYKKSAQQGNINAKKTQCIMCEDYFDYWSLHHGDEGAEYQKNYCKSVRKEGGFRKSMS